MYVAAAPETPPYLEPYVRGDLYGGGAWYGLAKRYPVLECFLVKPFFLFSRQFPDIGHHGRPAERREAQPEECKKKVCNRYCVRIRSQNRL